MSYEYVSNRPVCHLFSRHLFSLSPVFSLLGMTSPWCGTWNPPWDLGAEKFVLRAKACP